tara:strand:- start:2649 stop:3218 length:570 start_codon:yes stop_codon:yes gene_type:complete
MKKKIFKIIFIIFFLVVSIIIYSRYSINNETLEVPDLTENDVTYNSNILKDVNYTSKDSKGNEYIIKALKGEIDYSNSSLIYLTDVTALVKLNSGRNIKINSDFGKYNTDNNNTIFSKNVLVRYLENKITGEYLDFSIERNSMIISRNVVYTNLENILKADVIDIDIVTKDIKIFMYEKEKKVRIKSVN